MDVSHLIMNKGFQHASGDTENQRVIHAQYALIIAPISLTGRARHVGQIPRLS